MSHAIEVNHAEGVTLPIGDVTTINFTIKKYADKQILDDLAQLLSFKLDQGCRKFVFNFTEVEYLDEEAEIILINFQKKINVLGAKLAMFGVCKNLREIFELKKLDAFFHICRDERSALFELTKENNNTLSIEERRKRACANYLHIDHKMISAVRIPAELGENLMRISAVVEIPTGKPVDQWVNEHLH